MIPCMPLVCSSSHIRNKQYISKLYASIKVKILIYHSAQLSFEGVWYLWSRRLNFNGNPSVWHSRPPFSPLDTMDTSCRVECPGVCLCRGVFMCIELYVVQHCQKIDLKYREHISISILGWQHYLLLSALSPWHPSSFALQIFPSKMA